MSEKENLYKRAIKHKSGCLAGCTKHGTFSCIKTIYCTTKVSENWTIEQCLEQTWTTWVTQIQMSTKKKYKPDEINKRKTNDLAQSQNPAKGVTKKWTAAYIKAKKL